jgi:tRNA (cytidine/uridine-2'-O-)-methyltransferase
MNERALRRAGLDYHEFVAVTEHPNLDACLSSLETTRVFALSTKGRCSFFDEQFESGDAFVMGPETRGLPAHVRESFDRDRVLRLPMRPDNRSLNLANTAAVVLYEAWRQCNFDGSV